MFANRMGTGSLCIFGGVWPSDVDDIDLLCNPVVLEQFKNSLSRYIAVYLVEPRVKTGNGKSLCPLLKGTKQHAGDRQEAMAVSTHVPMLNMEKDCGQSAVAGGFDESFLPYVIEGCVRLVDGVQDVHVRTLRDAAACDSDIPESVLPLSSRTDTGEKNPHEKNGDQCVACPDALGL